MALSETLASLAALEHPVWAALAPTWETNERRYHAGVDATEDLTPFKWETGTLPTGERAATDALALVAGSAPSSGYQARQSRAVFPGYMGEFGDRLSGELFAKAPEPGEEAGAEGTVTFGSLGVLGYDAAGVPTRAQMLWDNADGVGEDARSWDAFWREETAAATATGFRWVYAEASATRPVTYADEINGARPYLVGLSPLDVPYWRESAGQLDAAVLRLSERVVTVDEGGKVTEADTPVFHVLVRKGYEGFGAEMAVGGWWVCDDKGAVLLDDSGKERRGDWSRTGGKIPLCRLYYERMPKTGARRKGGGPAGLRAGTYQLGAISAEIMDLTSVAFHDLWRSGMRQTFVGVRDAASAEMMVDRASDAIVFYPAAEGGATFNDTGDTSANDALVTERAALAEEARRYISRELVTSPDASGRAREIEHARGTAPRLASLATNVEEAQNFCLTMLCQRWTGTTLGRDGVPPRATWAKRFDLASVAEAMQPLVESLAAANASSPTVLADYVVAFYREVGALPEGEDGDAKVAQITAELTRSMMAGATQAEANAEAQRAGAEVSRRFTREAPDPAAVDEIERTAAEAA